jgi:hypothetical protein
MRIVLALLLFTVLQVHTVHAQSRGFLAAKFGKSIPTGEYGSMNYTSDKAGFATPGWSFDLSLGLKAGKHTGVMFNFHNQVNNQRTDILESAFRELNPDANFNLYSDGWRISGFFMGPYGTLRISEYSSFQPHLLLGYVSATAPSVNVSIHGKEPESISVHRTASTPTFASLIGGSFRFDGEKVISFYLNIDYLYSNPEFVKVRTSAYSNNNQIDQYHTYRQKMTSLHLGFGIGIWLNKHVNPEVTE